MSRFSKCVDCKERSIEPNCHSYCEHYAEGKAVHEAILKEIKKENEYTGYIVDEFPVELLKNRHITHAKKKNS